MALTSAFPYLGGIRVAGTGSISSVALPEPEASASTAAIDLGATGAYAAAEGDSSGQEDSTFQQSNARNTILVRVRLQDSNTPTLTPLTALEDEKTLVITLEESTDNSSFAASTLYPPITITGGSVPSICLWEFVVQPGTKRYIRATAEVEEDGGFVTDTLVFIEAVTV